MAQIKVNNAQYPLVFNVEIGPADVGNEVVIDVPAGFVLTGAANVIRTAFNGTTPTFTIVDNKQSPTTIVTGASSGTTGTASASTSLYTEYPNGGKIRILYVVASGATTAGRADVFVQGVIRGRQNERYGANVVT